MNPPSASPSLLPLLILLAVEIFLIVSLWKVFTKAGQPGWASIIPIYNIYIMLKIAGKPGWWLLLLMIPLVNLVVAIMWIIAFAKQFGRGVGFALGLAFLPFIFYPILAFDDSQFQPATA